MNVINKDNIEEFMNKYNDFHDSNFININYDIYKQNIEIIIEVFWKLNEKGEYERSENNLKMSFENTEECNIKEINSWDFIYEAYMKYVNIEDLGEMLCFASDKDDPLFYIICKDIQYEEIDK